MKAVIVCTSVSHGNTRRVADAIGEVLGADVVEPGEVDPATLGGHDLVGFGSGIFNADFHPRLRVFVDSLPAGGTTAFLFATCGFPSGPLARRLPRTLVRKGYTVRDTFRCRGFDTWLPFRLVGGLHRGRPDDGDLAAARAFAAGLRG